MSTYVELNPVDTQRLRMTRTVQAGKSSAKEIGITYALFNRLTCNATCSIKAEQRDAVLSFLTAFDERQPK